MSFASRLAILTQGLRGGTVAEQNEEKDDNIAVHAEDLLTMVVDEESNATVPENIEDIQISGE